MLLAKYPVQKAVTGQSLLPYLLHDCLFEIPHQTKGDQNQTAPKCKQPATR